MEKTIEELIYDETKQRLEEMKAPDYKFPEKADKNDAIGIIVAVGCSLLLILLCAMGVIV